MKHQHQAVSPSKAPMSGRSLCCLTAGAAAMLLAIVAVVYGPSSVRHGNDGAASVAHDDAPRISTVGRHYDAMSRSDKLEMLEALERAGQKSDEVLDILEYTQNDSDPTVRCRGIDIARSLGYEQWRTWLDLALRSPDVRLRARAVLLLHSGERIEDIDRALRLSQSDPEPAVRVVAAATFGRSMVDYAIAPFLLSLYDEEADPAERLSAAQVLMTLGRFSGHAEEYLEGVVRDGGMHFAELAALIMTTSGRASALLRFLELLEEGEPSVSRCALTHGLAELIFGEDIMEAFRGHDGELDYGKLKAWLLEDASRVYWDEARSRYKMRGVGPSEERTGCDD